MSSYLFDTNIISYFISGKYPGLNPKILASNPESRFINWVVQQELLYGVYRKNRLDLEILYQNFFQVCNIIQSDSQIVDICAKLETDLDNQGLVLGLEDIWIASTCLARGLILVTHNTKDFQNIPGLKVEDWMG